MTGRASIHVLALGGTIAMTAEDGEGATPSLTGSELVAAVPDLAETADVSAENFRQLPGASLRLADIVALRDHLGSRPEDGFVVTQGTDTLEETSFALDLLYRGDQPVVFTGAMRNPSLAGADGGANLLNAVRVAATPGARGQGVLLTLDDRIHAARFVQKRHSSAPSAFTSPSLGPIGWIAEDRVRLPYAVRERVHLDGVGTDLAKVALVRIGLDDDGRVLEGLTGSYDGAVIEAMGAGHVPSWLAEPVGDLAASMPVLLASRAGAGETFTSTYGFEGSERDLLGRGAIGAGALDGLKARILLTFALTVGWARAELEAGIRALTG